MIDPNTQLDLAANPLAGLEGTAAVLLARPDPNWGSTEVLAALAAAAERAGLGVVSQIAARTSVWEGISRALSLIKSLPEPGVLLVHGRDPLGGRDCIHAYEAVAAEGWRVRHLSLCVLEPETISRASVDLDALNAALSEAAKPPYPTRTESAPHSLNRGKDFA